MRFHDYRDGKSEGIKGLSRVRERDDNGVTFPLPSIVDAFVILVEFMTALRRASWSGVDSDGKSLFAEFHFESSRVDALETANSLNFELRENIQRVSFAVITACIHNVTRRAETSGARVSR